MYIVPNQHNEVALSLTLVIIWYWIEKYIWVTEIFFQYPYVGYIQSNILRPT